MQKLKEYLFTTLYMWATFTICLTPFAFLVWGLSFDQWVMWWASGLPANLIMTYPIGKGLVLIYKRLNWV